MRSWRFTEDGKTKDAVCFDDTFGLCAEVPFWNTMNKADCEKLNGLIKRGRFQYLCVWKEDIFPINDSESRSKVGVESALERAKNTGTCFTIMNGERCID